MMKKIAILILILLVFKGYSQIVVNVPFKVNTPNPIDTRMKVATVAERDALDPLFRYEGLMVYVIEDSTNYQLVKGTANSNWKEIAGDVSTPVYGSKDGFTIRYDLFQNKWISDSNLVNKYGGRIGIGTTGPQTKLHISNSLNPSILITDADYGEGLSDGLLIRQTDTNSSFYNHETGDMRFYVNNNAIPKMTIKSNGNIGIGYTDPSAKLVVNGNMGIGAVNPKNTLDVEGAIAVGAGYSGTSTAPSNGLIVQGNVGLGVTDPVNKLDVEGAAVIGSTYSGTNTAPSGGLLVYGNVGIGYTSPGAKLVVNGNVGIGLTSPKNKLDVEGGAVIGSSYSGTNTAPSGGLLVQGNVGIGATDPKNKLDVEGAAVIGSGYSGYSTAPTNGLLVEGRVGIGTTNPQSPLDVRSTTGGVRIPRLTNTQMDAVASPHSGEMVYNTTFQTLFIHNGNEWMLMESVRLVVWMSAWGAYHDGDFNESSDNSLYMKRLQVDRYCWDNTGNRSSAYNVHALLSVGVPDDMKYFPKLYGYDGRAPVWWGTWWGESHSMAANNWRSFMNNELITSIGGGVISHNILVLFADALYIASIGNKFIPWTGTADNGEHSTFNCQGWTNNDHSQDGKLSKITSSTDAGTWMSGDLEPCDSSHHVLCVGYDPRPQEIIPPP